MRKGWWVLQQVSNILSPQIWRVRRCFDTFSQTGCKTTIIQFENDFITFGYREISWWLTVDSDRR